MKKRIIVIFLSVLVVLNIGIGMNSVFAASFSVSGSKSVSPGGKTVVTIGGLSSLRGKFNVSVSNGSGNASFMANGQSSQTVSITAGSSGSVTVSVTAVDVFSLSEEEVSGTQTISVPIKEVSGGSSNPGGSSGGTSSPSVDTRSKENNLSSLSISQGTLSPEFSSGTTSYKVDFTSDISKFTIDAKAKDSKAKVSGTGEKELKIGENNFIITVVAENGAKKTYTISAYVTEKPSVFVKLSDKDYGILSDFSKADLPKGYSPTTVKIDEKDVAALKNDASGLTLLYLQDTEGATGFYIYENNAVIGKFQTITFNQKVYVIFNDKNAVKELSGVDEGTVKIGDIEVQGWIFTEEKLSNYSLVYLMNDTGEKGLYSYEGTEGTLQKYVSTGTSSNNTLTYVFGGTTVLFAAGCGVLGYLYISFKKKSISAIKDYYDSKNQGE